MLKIWFFLIIACCGVFIGLEMRNNLCRRVKSLEMLYNVFCGIKEEVMYSQKTLHNILTEQYENNAHNIFLEKLCKNLSGNSFDSAWKKTIIEQSKELCLTDEDVSFLIKASERIGKTDIDSQADSLTFVAARLKEIINLAKNCSEEQGKVYLAVGSSVGFILALMIV